MIRARISLRQRVAAGLLTSREAGRYARYLFRNAARRIRDARPYQASAPVPPLPAGTETGECDDH